MTEPQQDVPTVPRGLATWLGLILTIGQYAGAIAAFAASGHDDVAISALVTATATALTTILGRMYQGAKAIETTARVPRQVVRGRKWTKANAPKKVAPVVIIAPPVSVDPDAIDAIAAQLERQLQLRGWNH